MEIIMYTEKQLSELETKIHNKAEGHRFVLRNSSDDHERRVAQMGLEYYSAQLDLISDIR